MENIVKLLENHPGPIEVVIQSYPSLDGQGAHTVCATVKSDFTVLAHLGWYYSADRLLHDIDQKVGKLL